VRYGGVARWRPATGVEITSFFSRYDYGDEEQSPVIFTGGSYLPPRIKRRRFYGQDWAQWAGHSQNLGGIAKAKLSPQAGAARKGPAVTISLRRAAADP
jgi:iron complex outermembrane recepter protein